MKANRHQVGEASRRLLENLKTEYRGSDWRPPRLDPMKSQHNQPARPPRATRIPEELEWLLRR